MASSSDQIKTPLLIIIVVVLVGASVFNFFTDRSSRVLTEDEVKTTIEEYLKNHPETLVTANVQVATEKFIQENKESILKTLTEKPVQDEINTLINAYIQAHPEAIVASVENWQQRQVVERQQNAEKNIATKKDALEKDPNAPVAGNSKGDVTVVEFFDYNCGYCKRSFAVVNQLLQEDKKVRVVFKEFPILSPNSELAARAALAVHAINPKKYWEYHRILMENTAQKTEEFLLQKAEELGLNKDEVKTRMNSAEITTQINNDRELGKAIGVTGTPAFIINGQLVPGAVSIEELKEIIKQKRGSKS